MLAELRLSEFGSITGELDFHPGFNVLVGETGTGKSLLLSSILFLKGEKVGVVSEGSFVEAVFTDSEEETTLRREVKRGRSRYFFNGMRVPASKVREFLEPKVVFQSQRLAVELLKPSYQLKVLDTVSDSLALLEEYQRLYRDYREKLSRLEAAQRELQAKERELDLLRFQVQELEEALPLLEQEEELLNLKISVSKAQELKELREEALYRLYTAENSAFEQIGSVLSKFESIGLFPEIAERLSNIYYELESVISQIERELEPPDTDLTLDEIEERLYQIERLKRKYGNTLQDIKSFLKTAKERLARLENLDFEIEELQSSLEAVKGELKEAALKLSEARKKGARELERKVLKAFKELGLEEATFSVELTPEEEFQPYGREKVTFLFSGNPKLPPAPLSVSISGGELSRLLLILLSITSLPGATVVFDEIDAGMSGKILRKVAEKLKEIASKQQVVAVSHSPQVVAAADRVFKLEKLKGGRVSVRELTGREIEEELAVMISGKLTSGALQAARDLIKHWEERWDTVDTPQSQP
ncbi:AAA family ATPase [Thermovibrio ammonificans]